MARLTDPGVGRRINHQSILLHMRKPTFLSFGKRTIFVCATALLGLTLAGSGQRTGGGEGGGRGEVKPAATIASVTQNLKKFEGFYNFYYDEKTGKIYLEVDRWGQEFLYFSSLPEGIGNGGAERGQASAVVVKFIRMGARVFLLQP